MAGSTSTTRIFLTHVHHAGITVRSIERAIPFYRDVLGFKIEEPFEFGGEVMARVNGVAGCAGRICFAVTPTGLKIELLQFTQADSPSEQSWRPNNPGAMHLGIIVHNIDEVFAAAKAHGFETSNEIQTIPEGAFQGLRVIYVRDPYGAFLELIQPLPGMAM